MDLARAARDPWVWGQFLLIGVIGAATHLGAAQRWPLCSVAPLGWRIPGLLLLGLGLSVSLLGARSLGPNLTPGTEPLPTGVLVERGAYRHVRHPVYLGLILTLAGWAWWFANGWLGLVAGLASFGYFDRKAAAEERWLIRRFPTYREYQGRVPKLVPGLGPR